MSTPHRNSKAILTPSVPHNSYIDLKNKWAQNAFEYRYTIPEIFLFFTIIFLLGWSLSHILMFSFKSFQSTQIEIPISDPHYLTIIENNSEYIDYAASKNGGEVLYNLSAPEFHGSIAGLTGNNLKALISDLNGPEQCWPSLKNASFATIKLAAKIFPVGFSVVLPDSFAKTIPKRINVYSLDGDKSYFLQEILVEVDEKSEKMPKSVWAECRFHCQEPIQVIRIEVVENYGDQYTCVYQLRAHGLKTAK